MADAYTGWVRNGVVVFDGGSPPEGTSVRVEPVAAADPLAPTRDWLLELAAEADAPPPTYDRPENRSAGRCARE
jgi:hypothetical protein